MDGWQGHSQNARWLPGCCPKELFTRPPSTVERRRPSTDLMQTLIRKRVVWNRQLNSCIIRSSLCNTTAAQPESAQGSTPSTYCVPPSTRCSNTVYSGVEEKRLLELGWASMPSSLSEHGPRWWLRARAHRRRCVVHHGFVGMQGGPDEEGRRCRDLCGPCKERGTASAVEHRHALQATRAPDWATHNRI